MQFVFSEDQTLLAETLRDFLAKECTPEAIRAAWETPTARSRELWRKLAEVGVPGLLVPESDGGMGLDEIDAVLIHEEAGRAGLAEPLVATAVAVPLLCELRARGQGGLADAWLPRIAAGEAVVAVGHPATPFVEDAHVADLLLLPAADGAALHALPRDAVEIEEQPANDPSRRIARVRFDPAPASRVAEGDAARELLAAALDRGALACAAGALGAADRMIALAVAYTSQRKQFGVPIGSFQAVKHGLANVKVKLEYARPLVYRAAWSVARGAAERSVHVSMAKVAACEAAEATAKATLQAHGAIGYTWEQDLHLFMRRAWSLSASWGRNAFHHDRVRAAVLGGRVPIGAGATFPDAPRP